MKCPLHLSKTAPVMASFIIVLISYAFALRVPEKKPKFISIQQLISEKKLEVKIKGLGGHQQECIQFDLENLTGDTVFLQIEPGRRLHSEDTLLQDILIVKHQDLALPPFASTTVKGYGFCCKSHHRSPGVESEFSIGAMAPESWQKLAKLIDQNTFPPGAVQAAIWSISNDHPISAITDKNPNSIELLKRTVASIKGIEVPWYTLIFEEAAADHVFSGKYQSLTGELKYHVNGNTVVSMVVKNESGYVVQTLMKGQGKGSGNYVYNLNLNVAGWPKGTYTIYIYEDYTNLNKKMGFVL